MEANQQSAITRWLRSIGSVISLVLVAFLIYRLFQSGGLQEIPDFLQHSAKQAYLSIVLLVLAGLLGASAWHVIFNMVNDKPIGIIYNISVMFFTQIYKYLPLNVFHYVGRYVYLQRDGYSNKSLTLANILEVSILISTASVVSTPAILQNINRLALPFITHSLFWVIVVLLIVAGATSALLISDLRERTMAIYAFCRDKLKGIASAILIYIANFVALGLALRIIIEAVAGTRIIHPLYATSVFAAAWVIGLITPGASAGIGVRETLMSVLLTPFTTFDQAVVIATLMRVVSFLADLVIWALGFLMTNFLISDRQQPDLSD